MFLKSASTSSSCDNILYNASYLDEKKLILKLRSF